MINLKTAPYVAVFDRTAKVYEVFRDADCDSYVGCCDTRADAERIARDQDRRSRELTQRLPPGHTRPGGCRYARRAS